MEKESLEEIFLKKKFPVELKTLKDEEKFAFNNLKKRKGLIKTKLLKLKTVKLVKLGNDILKKGIKEGKVTDMLTSSMLKTGQWKGKTFRRYDVEINVPEISGGKRHFVKKTIEYAKKIWLELGFEEMKGPIVESEFWTFDTLFVPQDHPARDMQDTFFLKGKATLPRKQLVNYVKKAHEIGVDGSKGWQCKYDEMQAKQTVLRPHTTGVSARTLAALKLKDLPKKFFIIGRNYRNETLDWAHLFEFNQTDGIVIDENVTFRDLLGYLKEFFKKMGFEKARFRPAHFPYTEPSVEIDVYHPVKKQWIELGGAGMFRPELTEPLLGKPVPVLAWGLGLARLIALTYDLKDIRSLYKNDLKQLRELKCLQ